MQEEQNNMSESAGKSKRMSFSKKAIGWYTFFSFLFVTLMIFIAVMLSYSSAEKTVGETYSKQIALRSLGFNEEDVTSLSSEQTYYNGAEAFKVRVTRGGVEHTVYVDLATARVCDEGTSSLPETPSDTTTGAANN